MEAKFTKLGIVTFAFVALFLTFQDVALKAYADRPQPVPNQTLSVPKNTPTMFIENVGQFDNDARFQMRGDNYTLWLADNVIWITALESLPTSPVENTLMAGDYPAESNNAPDEDDLLHGVHVRLSFPGANAEPTLEPIYPLTTNLSYFRGPDPAGWQSIVPVWGGVRYTNLYPNIDLELSSAGTFNLICQAACDTSLQSVKLQVEGGEDLALTTEGQLQLHTDVGTITLPLFTASDAKGRSLDIKRLTPFITNHTVALPLITDDKTVQDNQILAVTDNPDDLLYSTFLGGNSGDVGLDIAVDENGNTYITGETYNNTFPTTPGAFDTSHNGMVDVFVVKLDPTGSNLIYGTFLGGDYLETGTGIAINQSGEAYVIGVTGSPNFPTTPGAFDRSSNGSTDAFVAKLDVTGSTLLYSTYVGGGSSDGMSDIALDEAGNAYISGSTRFATAPYPNFPTTPGAYDTTHNGNTDAFVVKLNAAGSALLASTLLGGGSVEGGSSIVLDNDGNIIIGGNTESATFPTTPGTYDDSFNGVRDIFVAKLTPDFSTLLFSTFLGGDDSEGGGLLAAGPDQTMYITGTTGSVNFPVTPGTFDSSHNDSNDVFVVQLDLTSSTLLYGTFIGGGTWDIGQAITSDNAGNVYITGETSSGIYLDPFPTTLDAFDTSFNGSQDVFVVKMNPSIGNGMLYSTFLGDSSDDEGEGIAVDKYGNVYVTGETFSTAFPVTPGAFDLSGGGDREGFVSKLALGVVPTDILLSGPDTGKIGVNHTFTATVGPPEITWPLSYTWAADGHSPVVQVNGLQDSYSFNWASSGPKTVTVTASLNGQTVTATHTIVINEILRADFAAAPTAGPAPLAVNFQNLSVGDFTSCLWDFGDGYASDLCTDLEHTYDTPGIYTVTLTINGPEGISSLAKTNYITVYEPVQANFSAISTSGIAPLTVHFTNLSEGEYESCLWAFGDGDTIGDCNDIDHLYATAGVYTPSLTITGPGGTDDLTQAGLIMVHEPVRADFAASPSSGLAPLTVNFSNLSTGNFDTCLWEFGDGLLSADCQDPSHVFETKGVYTVSLTVHGLGGTNSFTMINAITVHEPVLANFSATPTSGTVPLPVQFTNLSGGDYSSCLWEFGDGSTSNLCDSPSHLYTTPGIYTVSLTVTGTGGEDVLTHTDYITVTLHQLFLPIVQHTGD